ncbi:MAG: DUF169 domain-containing protein [Nitrospirota bacterium]
MTLYTNAAKACETILRLTRPPVALAPITETPRGVPFFEGVSPSACSFWTHAERRLFVARDTDHMQCPIGAMTMGFELTAEAKAALEGGLTLMTEVGYIDPKEAEHLPSLPPGSNLVLYGPLATFPIPPALVLLWLTPAQAMLMREATGDVAWKADVASNLFGRPSCAALAIASRDGNVALSFGCNGMRTFTGVDPSLMLAAISGRLVDTLAESLERADKAQCSMQKFYDQQQTYFPFTAKPASL